MLLSAAAIRHATPADWDDVARLLQAVDLPLDGAREHLDTFLVARDGGSLRGMAGLEVYGIDALLRSVATAPEARGTGLGRALVRAILDDARRRGIRGVYLLTTTAEAFFPRFGFVRIGWEAVPEAVKASPEFNGACPTTAAAMALELSPPPPPPPGSARSGAGG